MEDRVLRIEVRRGGASPSPGKKERVSLGNKKKKRTPLWVSRGEGILVHNS